MVFIAKNFIYLQATLLAGWLIFRWCLGQKYRPILGHLPFLILTALNAALFFSPAFALVHAILLVLPVAAARTRQQLLIIMLVGTLGIPALPTHLAAGGIDLFSWSLQTTYGLGGLLALFATKTDRDREPPVANAVLILFLTLMIAIASRETNATNWVRQAVATLCAYGVPTYVIGECLRSPSGRRTFLVTLASLGSMISATMIYESRVHWPLYVSLEDKYGFVRTSGLIVKFRGGVMRAFGPLDDATGAGFALVIMLAATLACQRMFRPGAIRYIIPAIVMWGILAPQSRGALIGAGIVILGYAFYRAGPAGLAKIGAIMAPLAALYYAKSSITGENSDAQGTSDYRQRLFTRGMEEFWHHPIVGQAMHRVVARMEDLRQGEGIIDFVNSYLYFALAAGAIGFVVFCIIEFLPAAAMLARRKTLNANEDTSSFAAFTFSALLAASFMLVFTSIPQRPMIVTLAVAGAGLALRRTRTRPVRPMIAKASQAHSANISA